MAIISGGLQQSRGQTYGAISLPFTPAVFEPVVDEEKATSLKGKLKTAFNTFCPEGSKNNPTPIEFITKSRYNI